MTNVTKQMTYGIYLKYLIFRIIGIERKRLKERGMDMGWTLILIIWIVYPIVGTIAIIMLIILNEKRKQQIAEMLEEKQVQKDGTEICTVPEQEPEMAVIITHEAVEGAAGAVQDNDELVPNYEVTVLDPIAVLKPIPYERPVSQHKKIQVHPGMAALIIGVIFVVIAGLVFATTNWYILPDVFKVIMVLGLSALFFVSSKVAENRLKIERTGRAFYILGSVFLFLAVLAIGYFRVFGPGFVLEGSGRWWVLWVGSVVTETAFLLGFRKYKERAFTFVYLGGLTISVTFLMAALRTCGIGFANGMVCYAFMLLSTGWLDDRYKNKTGKGFLPENASVVWDTFSAVNFALFAGVRIPNVLLELLLADGTAYQTTPWKIFCVGLMAAGVAILASRQKNRVGYKILYRVMLAVFLQYAVMGLPMAMEYRYLAAAVLHGGWFTLARRNRKWLWTEPGDVLMTGAAAGNAGLLMICAVRWMTSLSTQITASVAILILAGVMVQWSRQYPVLRRVILYLLGMLTVTGYGICIYAGVLGVRYHYILFAYLVLAAVWDIVKKDCFWADILLIGAAAQVISPLLGMRTSPFFLLLAVYLYIKTRGQEAKGGQLLFKASCICSLVGVYMELYWRLPNQVLAMFVVLALFAAEYLMSVNHEASCENDKFWDVTGSMVFVALMVELYQSDGLGIGYLAVCLCLFFLIYGKLYRRNGTFTHLPMALMMLPLPWHIAIAYDFTDGQILGGTAIAILASGILFRLHGPVHVTGVDGEHTLRVDWYHILVGPVLVILILILAGDGDRGWESVYILLLILYVLQFAMTVSLRKAAVTLAMALGIWLWWRQPFITIPEFAWLEVNLLPIAAAAAVLTKVWGDGPNVRGLRTGIHALCLVLLTMAAFFTGDVRDALILEIICLTAFLAASKADNRLWKNISGFILVLVVLYMTKGFWLSLSWWVYLLAAGIVLIVFAAWNEMKRK